MTQAAYRLVEELQDSIARAESEFHRAYWDSQVEASPSSERRRSDAELELRRIKGNKEAHAAVLDALNGDVHDPVLARQLEILRLSLTGNQMDDALREDIVGLSAEAESLFAGFRPALGDRSLAASDIEEMLQKSTDSEERRAVWEASKEIGIKAAPLVRELARLRNRAAHELGYADFYRMSLDLQELPEDWLVRLLSEVDAATESPYVAWKERLDRRLRSRFGLSQLEAWHYSDPFFQQLPNDDSVDLDHLIGHLDAVAVALDTFDAWGFDLHDVVGRSDLYPRTAKCEHAFCLDVDRSGDDVRLLCNVVPGARWIDVMLHECGHAAYDLSIEDSLPYLLHRPTHIFVTEAIALLSGSLVRDRGWLLSVAGVDAAAVDAVEPALRAGDVGQKLLFARWCLVMSNFEREMYADPEGDLDSLWWDMVERFQRVSRPEGRSAPDWAAKIHLAGAPVYYHNYLLGELLANQLRSAISHQHGELAGSRSAGEFMRERIFRHGALVPWNALVESATGHPLAPGDFVATIAG